MPMIFEPIKAKLFDPDIFMEEYTIAMQSALEGIYADYLEGVKGWKTKVVFSKSLEVNTYGIRIVVDTDNEIYGFVHEGTSPHLIRPKRAKRLRFKSGYKAKTQPGNIMSGPGGSFGPIVTANIVRHPGNKGRFFSKPIFKKWRPYIIRQLGRATKKAIKRTGHGVR